MPLSAFQQFCADTGCNCSPQVMALWTQRNDAVAERDKLKEEREQIEKQPAAGIVLYSELSGYTFRPNEGYASIPSKTAVYTHPPVPDGKVLVPIRPTAYMLEQMTGEWHIDKQPLARERYAAMLKAAQQGQS